MQDLTFSFQCSIPMMTRIKTHTPINAIAVSKTILLGVRYSFALQLHRYETGKRQTIQKFSNSNKRSEHCFYVCECHSEMKSEKAQKDFARSKPALILKQQ